MAQHEQLYLMPLEYADIVVEHFADLRWTELLQHHIKIRPQLGNLHAILL